MMSPTPKGKQFSFSCLSGLSCWKVMPGAEILNNPCFGSRSELEMLYDQGDNSCSSKYQVLPFQYKLLHCQWSPASLQMTVFQLLCPH